MILRTHLKTFFFANSKRLDCQGGEATNKEELKEPDNTRPTTFP